ncbi:hypothetical protein GH733_015377 [Mirounga leonina]|nr:hypothetical protein GH733_015377 [Mirounga leonina]
MPAYCELSQGEAYPRSIFLSWHCPALAGVQDAAMRHLPSFLSISTISLRNKAQVPPWKDIEHCGWTSQVSEGINISSKSLRKKGACRRAQSRGGLGDPLLELPGPEKAHPLRGRGDRLRSAGRTAMESSWLEMRWARPLYLAFVFCLALGLLQAIKLYLRRLRLLRDLCPFLAPPTHWF